MTAAELVVVLAAVLLSLGFAALVVALLRVLDTMRDLRREVDDLRGETRMLIDDLNTLLRDASTPQIRDGLVAAIDAHPNIQVRLFNPWTRRDLFGRAAEMVDDLERLNQRMHNKLMVVDGLVGVLGGRNIADRYRQ